jgi:hypothetical protein
MTAETAIEDIAKGMARAARMRAVGQLCLQAALTRIASEVSEVMEVHAAAIANAPPDVAAELRRLQDAAAQSLAALKGYAP